MIWFLGGYMWLYVHRPFEYYGFLGELQLERVYMLVMLAFWVVSPAKGLLPNRLHLALALFTVAIVVCWVASPWREQGYDTLENYLKVMVFYTLVVTTVRDERGLRKLVALYLLAVGLYMGHSMLEYLHGRYEWRQGIRRMIGVDVTYYDPNAFASTLLLSLPLTLPFWAEARGWLARLPLLAYTAAACGCILLTGSRSGFMGLCLFGACCLLLSRHRVRGLVVASAAVVVLVCAMPGYLAERFLTIVDSSHGPRIAQESALGRLAGFAEGMRLWGDNLLLGVGPGVFRLATKGGFNSHNVYGQVGGELGVLGVAAFLALLACFLTNGLAARRLYRAQPRRPRDFPFYTTRAVAVTVLLLLFTGMAGHNLYRYNWVWLAAFQAIALHCARTRGAAPALAPAPPPRPARLAWQPTRAG
jgi:O-Antigen ligase